MSSRKFNADSFSERLSLLNRTKESIHHIAQWILEHKNHCFEITNVWLKSVEKADVSHRLILFYVANDVVQQCKKQDASRYREAFANTLELAMPFARDASLKHKIERLVTIWEERGIYHPDFLRGLHRKLNEDIEVEETRSESPINLNEAGNFKLNLDLALKELKKLSAAVRKQRLLGGIENFSLDPDSISSIGQTQGVEILRRLNPRIANATAYISALEKETEQRRVLIGLLEKTDKFYSRQLCDVQTVVKAYRAFGRKVKRLQKSLAGKTESHDPCHSQASISSSGGLCTMKEISSSPNEATSLEKRLSLLTQNNCVEEVGSTYVKLPYSLPCEKHAIKSPENSIGGHKHSPSEVHSADEEAGTSCMDVDPCTSDSGKVSGLPNGSGSRGRMVNNSGSPNGSGSRERMVDNSAVPVQMVDNSAVPVQMVDNSAVPVQMVDNSAVPVQMVDNSAVPVQMMDNSAVPVQMVDLTEDKPPEKENQLPKVNSPARQKLPNESHLHPIELSDVIPSCSDPSNQRTVQSKDLHKVSSPTDETPVSKSSTSHHYSKHGQQGTIPQAHSPVSTVSKLLSITNSSESDVEVMIVCPDSNKTHKEHSCVEHKELHANEENLAESTSTHQNSSLAPTMPKHSSDDFCNHHAKKIEIKETTRNSSSSGCKESKMDCNGSDEEIVILSENIKVSPKRHSDSKENCYSPQLVYNMLRSVVSYRRISPVNSNSNSKSKPEQVKDIIGLYSLLFNAPSNHHSNLKKKKRSGECEVITIVDEHQETQGSSGNCNKIQDHLTISGAIKRGENSAANLEVMDMDLGSSDDEM